MDLLFCQDKPLPPSRPLPPLATKLVNGKLYIFGLICLTGPAIAPCVKCQHLLFKIMKPKPPMPPVKPKPSTVSSPLPHTLLVRIQTAPRVIWTFLHPSNSDIWHSNIPGVIQGIHVNKDICGFENCPNMAV